MYNSSFMLDLIKLYYNFFLSKHFLYKMRCKTFLIIISYESLTHSTYQLLKIDKTSKKKRKRVALTIEQ